MNDLISIIVPVYNSELYIEECVKSVLAQTYPYFELFLLDDGSSDNSKDICERMCKEDKRIQLIQCPHKGVSATRNIGLKSARGKYLFFLDSDDAIHPQLLETLYKLQEVNGTAMATIRHVFVEDEKFCKRMDCQAEKSVMQESTYLENQKAIDFSSYGNTDVELFGIGGKMILREAVKDMRFNEKRIQCEDALFIYNLLAKGADISVLHRDWYYYRQRKGSASSTFSAKGYRDRYQVFRHICDQEMKCGRTFNAMRWEDAILEALMRWYGEGNDNHNKSMMECVKKLAYEEKKLEIFSKASEEIKVRYYQTFDWRPEQKRTFLLSQVFRKNENFILVYRKIWNRMLKWKSKWYWRLRRTKAWIWNEIQEYIWKYICKVCIRFKWIIKRKQAWLKRLIKDAWGNRN